MTECALILHQEEISEGIFSLWLLSEQIAPQSRSGQFVCVYSRDGSRLLPRPISICETDREGGKLRLVYRVAGEGTKEFSSLKKGDTLRILGPLGNGYPTGESLGEKQPFVLVGGGIGIPPLLQLAKDLPGEKIIVLGYRDKVFLHEDFAPLGTVLIATEDGSAGTRGNVIDAIQANAVRPGVLLACGPMPMLKGLKSYAQQTGTLCYLSLEERMACGMGACLACVCKTKEKDDHTQVHNRRICTEGPVFNAEDVVI